MTRAEAAALMHQQQLKCGIKPPASAIAAREIKPRRGTMNGLEKAFAATLEEWRLSGVVRWYAFEGVKLRLAQGAYFCPDFAVLFDDGDFGFYECKGFWREAGRLRMKVAAEAYPHWMFNAVQQVKGQWVYEAFYSPNAPLAKEAT